MPDRDAAERQSARQLTAMIWAGVGLVPVAVLIVLIGGGDRSLRFAVLVMAVSVVLVGASLLIRNDPDLLRMDVADRVADEAGILREELREEVAAAARVTHHRVQALQDEVARLHRERMPSGSGWPATEATAPDPSRGHLPGAAAPTARAARGAAAPAGLVAVDAATPAARGAVTGAARVPRPSTEPDPRAPAGPVGMPSGGGRRREVAGRGREVAGPGQPAPSRGPVPVARAAATVRPVDGASATAAATAPVDRTAGGPPGPVVTGSGERSSRPDDIRRPRRAERRGRRSADRDFEGVDAAPSSWLAEPDSGWLIRPGEGTGTPPESRPDDVPWSYEREPSRRHRSADAYDAGQSGIQPTGYGTEPGRRRRRAADEADDSW